MVNSKKITKRQSREQAIRREKVKELYLQAIPATKIAAKVGAHYNTVLSDIEHIKDSYLELAIRDPNLIQKQFGKVEELLDEVKLVRQQYWEILSEIKEEKEAKQKSYDEEYERALAKAKNEDAKLDIKRKVAGRNFSTRLETLRAIMTRVDHEAKLLNLFNSGTIIEKNYISLESLKQIMSVFKGIILDLIPQDKQNYAIRRMKTIDIQGISPDDVKGAQDTKSVEDAEYTEKTSPKVASKEPEKEIKQEDFNLDTL